VQSLRHFVCSFSEAGTSIQQRRAFVERRLHAYRDGFRNLIA
jgi:hypothetical protein